MASDPKTERDLHQRARDRLGERDEAGGDLEKLDLRRLVQELELHQEELEIQNEVLREAQLASDEARDRYFDLYELAPVGYMTLGPDGYIIDANLAAARLAGVPRKQLAGAPLSRYVRQGAGALAGHLRDVFRTGTKQRCEVALGTPGDATVPVLLDSIASPGGATPHCITAVVDLTERKRAEDEVRDREARLRAILDTAVDGIVTVDSRGVLESCNPAVAEMFGWSVAEMIGREIGLLMPEYERGAGAKLAGELSIAGGVPPRIVRRRLVGRRRNGREFPLEMSLGRMEAGGERKAVGVLRDVSESEARARDLKESLERFEQLAARVEDVFFIVDRATAQVRYLSPAFERIWGQPPESALGDTSRLLDTVHPEDRERVGSAHRECIETGHSLDHEYRIVRPDGTVRRVRERVFPSPRGGRVVGTAQDVTDERRLEEDLLQAQKMEAVGALASGVAHDFNNLLMGILGCVRLARKSIDRPEVASELLDEGARAAERGASLTRQLLAFSRRTSPRPEPLEIDTLVSGARRLLGTLVGEHVRLSIALGAAGVHVLASPGEIEQILMNLAGNGRDAMREGGELFVSTAEHTLTAEEAARRALSTRRLVALTVRDTGCGMDEATRARIFEPFFTTKDVGEGTGLGLSTTFAIARRLGGWLTVDSAPGQGSTFTVHFPVAETEAARGEAPAEQEASGSGTVLLVEDESLVRLVLQSYLQSLGYRAVVADGYEQALSVAAREERIDAVITDVFMPGHMGPELAAALRTRSPDLRVLYISACGHEELCRLGRIAPSDHLLEKPFEERDLGRALRVLLASEAPASAPDTAAPDTSAPDTAAAASASKTGATLLLVEDSNASRLAMQDCLESLGYRVRASGWPSEALEIARAEPIDLIITDATLPEMEGDALIERLRAIRPDVPAIVISGYPPWEVGTRERFLQKPVPFDRLKLEVARALGDG